MPENDHNQRRAEAREALEGPEYKRRQAELTAKREKRLEEARRAMEDGAHRQQRVRTAATAAATAREAERRAGATREEKTLAEAARREAAAHETSLRLAEEERKQKVEAAGELTHRLTQTAAKLESLRTLKSDMGRAVGEKGISVAQIALGEAGKKRFQDAPAPKISFAFLKILLSLFLLLAAGGLFWWFVFYAPAPAAGPSAPAAPPAPIFAEIVQGLELNALPQALTDSLNEPLSNPPAIKHLYFRQDGRTVGFAAFTQALGLSVPETLSRHLDDQFMFGIFNGGGDNQPFLLLQARSFELVWRGFLDWEETMAADLRPIFGPLTPAIPPLFTDQLINNKDARILKNAAGQTILFYAFLDNQIVAITPDEEVFEEILRRFLAD